jgi:hypothetical protein
MAAHKLAQTGIGHIAIMFAVVFVAVVGFAGWKVATMNKDAGTETAATVTTSVPDKISSKGDLVQTSKALDDASSGLDSSLNDGAFNADLNDML